MGNQNSSQDDTTNASNVNLEEAIKLSMHLRKQTIQSSSFNAQQFPMLTTLSADTIKTSRKAPIDLVCVIDRSGSMSGEKIELVKNSFKYLLNYLGDSDRISIVIFDDNVDTLVPLGNATNSNKEAIMSKLQGVEGRGGTDINLGMERAFKILKGRWTTNPVTSIFLLSDGLDNGARDKVEKSLHKSGISKDVTIHSFGFGQDHDPELMSGIARLRDGNFYFIKELDTVDEVFVDCLGGLLSCIGKNVEIKIQPIQSDILKGVQIVKAYGDSSMWSQQNGTYSTKIANLISGSNKNFVLELSIPINTKALQEDQKLIPVAKAQIEVTGLDGKKVSKTVELHITLLNEDEQLKSEEDNREVMKNFYRVKGASLIGEAKALADSRNYNEAEKILKGFKEELEHSFLKEEEFIKNLIKDIERTIGNLNPVVYEQYGKIEMLEDCQAQMYEKTNFKSANCYRNSVQTAMIKEVKKMKGK